MLVFVMAILVLLALLGLGMMIATRGERQKLTPEREALALETVMDRAIRIVRERLRDDIWGPKPPTGWTGNELPLTGSPAPDDGYVGDPPPPSNEPFDAPGPEDRWLSSTLPYADPTSGELIWFRVSYLGPIRNEPVDGSSNLNAPRDRPDESEPSDLRDLVLSDPRVNLPSFGPGAIPTWSPRDGRRLASLSRGSDGVQDSFWDDYKDIYDVDGNQKFDLYDADGDGVPDSLISFTFPVDTPAPTADPKRVHVAIRIVDNASKANVNTSNSRFKVDKAEGDPGALDPTFDESTPDMQLRGRRVGEVFLDAVTRGDSLDAAETRYPVRDLVRSLWGRLPPGPITPSVEDAYLAYYHRGIRRQLVGGAPLGTPFQVYGPRDELSLTHRFCLVPYTWANLVDPAQWVGRIDEDLYYSLCWSRRRMGNDPPDALEFPKYQDLGPPDDKHRWQRFGLDERLDAGASNEELGWGSLLNVGHRWVLKRPLLTVYNGESDRRLPNRNEASGLASTTYQVVLGSDSFDRRLSRTASERDVLKALGWPAEDAFAYPMRGDGTGNAAENVVAGLYDYEKVSLNYPIGIDGVLTDEEKAKRKADYVTMLAWAFYVSNGIPVTVANPVEAWQAAVNICDYRDADDTPTLVKDSTGTVLAAGVERQPFITEVHVHIDSEVPANNTLTVELYNPYPIEIDADDAQWGFEIQLQGAPAGMDPGTIPATGRLSVVLSLANPAGLDENAVVELVRDIPGTSPTVSVVCDRFRLTGAEYVRGSGTWAGENNFQRDETGWRFTSAVSSFDNDAYVANTQNDVDLSGVVKPSHWPIRNTGIVVDTGAFWVNHWWTLDTPGELSRVLMWANASSAGPVTERLAVAQIGATTEPDKLAAGRLDFFRLGPLSAADPDPRNILGYVTSVSANHDGINNDGDKQGGNEQVDEPPETADDNGNGRLDRSEADTINYRRVGRININTAPLPVLYAVPFMSEPYLAMYLVAANPSWDIAAGLVTLREDRQVTSVFGKGGQTTGPPAADTRYPMRFRSLGDLGEVSASALSGNAKFAIDRFVTETLGPREGSQERWPDFDGTTAAVPEATDAHDGSDAVANDIRERDIFLARWANILTTRSDVYTVYIALLDDDGRYLRRCQLTLDRTNCFANPVDLPTVIGRVDTNYYDDTR